MAYMTKMTKRKVALLALIEESEPLSIYQLARKAGRNYRRVHDHVHDFAGLGWVRISQQIRNGRKVSIVEQTCHQRLKRLDDMYAFRKEIHATQ